MQDLVPKNKLTRFLGPYVDFRGSETDFATSQKSQKWQYSAHIEHFGKFGVGLQDFPTFGGLKNIKT